MFAVARPPGLIGIMNLRVIGLPQGRRDGNRDAFRVEADRRFFFSLIRARRRRSREAEKNVPNIRYADKVVMIEEPNGNCISFAEFYFIS